MTDSIQDIEKLLVELIGQNRAQAEEIRFLREENALLKARISQLECIKDSHNSHLPPSKDPIGKKRPSLVQPTGRKSGGQKGHPGHSLAFQQADKIEEVSHHYCTHCGFDLSGIQGEVGEVRQQIDLPAIHPVVTEYRQIKKECPCCSHPSQGDFPAGLSQGISYGCGVESLVSYLNVCQHIPYKRLSILLKEVFGLPLSEGTISNILQRMQKRSFPAYQAIQSQLSQEAVAGADETGHKVKGKLHWAWVVQSIRLTYMAAGLSRQKKEFTTIMPGGMPQTILVSDCLTLYFSQDVAHHQICTAHLLRELIGLAELYKNHSWCEKMASLIREAIHLRKTVKGKIESVSINNRLDTLLKQKIGKSFEKIITLQNRLLKYREYLFYFLLDENVPPDNNASERAIRKFKIKTKVSGGFNSDWGAQCFAQLHSIVDTAIKNGKEPLAVLKAAAMNV